MVPTITNHPEKKMHKSVNFKFTRAAIVDGHEYKAGDFLMKNFDGESLRVRTPAGGVFEAAYLKDNDWLTAVPATSGDNPEPR